MSNTVVGFTIQIDGVNSINDLNEAIKNTKNSMNALDITTEAGNKEFNELSQTLGELTAQQKALKKAQDDTNKSFLPEKSVGAYDALSAQLNKLRKEFKNAALDGSKTTAELDKMQSEIKQLDKTLKDVDGQVGQFQRSVGDYPRTFQRVTRSLYQAIPGFEAFSSQLRTSEGGITTFGKALIGGFLAFQAANLIGNAIGKLDEFNKKIEETRNIVMQTSGAYGKNLDELTASTAALAQTFDTDAKTITEAAKAISKEFGIGFEEALGKVEGALVEGKGNANDYLNKIKEMPAAFQEAGGAITEVSEGNKRLLDSNKELATSQINVAKQTKDIVLSFKEFKNALTGQLINLVVSLYNALKPIGMAFYDLGKAVYNFLAAIGGIFTSGGQAISVIDLFAAALRLSFAPAQFIISLVAGLINVLTQFAPIIFAAGVAIGGFTLAMNLQKIALALTAAAQFIYNGAVAAYTVVTNIAKAAQLAFNAAVKANPIGLIVGGLVAAGGAVAAYALATDDSTEATKKNTDEIKKAEDAAKAKAEADQKIIDDKIKADQEAFNKEQKIAEDKRKADEEAKRALEKYNQAVEKLSQDRVKFIDSELAAQKNALALLSDLRARYIDEQIKNIKDDQERQVKEIKIGAERQLLALDEQLKALQETNKARAEEGNKQLQEAVKLYGKGSKEVAKIREENAKAIEQAGAEEKLVAAEIANIKVEVTKKANSDIDKSNSDTVQAGLEKAKQAAEDLRQFRNDILQEEQGFIENTFEMRELKNREMLARMLAQETDAKKKEELIRLAGEQEIVDKIAMARNQLMSLDDAQQQLEVNGQKRVDVTQEEYDAILLAKQKLNTEIAELEGEQTEDVKKNAEERLKANVDTFNKIAGYFKQGLDLLADVLSALNEQQQAQIDADIERSEERQTSLQEEIENSTGLRRRFFEERLRSEIAAQQQLEKAKEEIAKRGAKQQKAIAIIQSIINTALAITSALATPPAPNVVAATIAGIVGAAQTAIIAAQPLARGGVVGKLSGDIVQFAGGGKVTSSGNIKPLSNGDNVLATLKTGEIVLNKEQQSRIGYNSLKAARIPNFATGGVVGAPSAFVSEKLSEVTDGKNRLLLMEQLLQETSNRIDRFQVVYTASTDDDVEKGRTERKDIRVTASF
jgi:hypothetical protein